MGQVTIFVWYPLESSPTLPKPLPLIVSLFFNLHSRQFASNCIKYINDYGHVSIQLEWSLNGVKMEEYVSLHSRAGQFGMIKAGGVGFCEAYFSTEDEDREKKRHCSSHVYDFNDEEINATVLHYQEIRNQIEYALPASSGAVKRVANQEKYGFNCLGLTSYLLARLQCCNIEFRPFHWPKDYLHYSFYSTTVALSLYALVIPEIIADRKIDDSWLTTAFWVTVRAIGGLAASGADGAVCGNSVSVLQHWRRSSEEKMLKYNNDPDQTNRILDIEKIASFIEPMQLENYLNETASASMQFENYLKTNSRHSMFMQL